MLSLLKKLLSSFWGGVWGAQKPPENLKIGILGGFGGAPKISQNKKIYIFSKVYHFLWALSFPKVFLYSILNKIKYLKIFCQQFGYL